MTSDRDVEEEEVEFDEETIQIIDRLVTEGRFDGRSDFAAYSIEVQSIDSPENYELDPSLDQRIREINQINGWVEDNTLRHFFLNTSYLMQEYSRLAKDVGKEEIVNEVEQYMVEQFGPAIGNSQMPDQDIDYFLDRTVELTSDFWNLSESEDAGYEEIIINYEDEYLEDQNLKSLLADQ